MTRPIREIVGERVLVLRRRARLSQPELAQQADMSVTTLNRVENVHQSLYMEKIAATQKRPARGHPRPRQHHCHRSAPAGAQLRLWARRVEDHARCCDSPLAPC